MAWSPGRHATEAHGKPTHNDPEPLPANRHLRLGGDSGGYEFSIREVNDAGQIFASHRCRCERMDPAGARCTCAASNSGPGKSSDSNNNAAPANLCHTWQGIMGTHYFTGHDHHRTAPSVSQMLLSDGRLHAWLSGGKIVRSPGSQQQKHHEREASDRWSSLSVDECCFRSGQLRRLLKRLAL